MAGARGSVIGSSPYPNLHATLSGGRVAEPSELWHFNCVRNRFYQRWFVMLGMFAMLGALFSVPLTATYALAMAGTQPTVSHSMTMADAKGRNALPQADEAVSELSAEVLPGNGQLPGQMLPTLVSSCERSGVAG